MQDEGSGGENKEKGVEEVNTVDVSLVFALLEKIKPSYRIAISMHQRSVQKCGMKKRKRNSCLSVFHTVKKLSLENGKTTNALHL